MNIQQFISTSSYATLPHGFLILALMVAGSITGVLAGMLMKNSEVLIRSRTWFLIIALFAIGTWQPSY